MQMLTSFRFSLQRYGHEETLDKKGHLCLRVHRLRFGVVVEAVEGQWRLEIVALPAQIGSSAVSTRRPYAP